MLISGTKVQQSGIVDVSIAHTFVCGRIDL